MVTIACGQRADVLALRSSNPLLCTFSGLWNISKVLFIILPHSNLHRDIEFEAQHAAEPANDG